MIGVAIIGTGYMSEVFAGIINRLQNARLVAVHNRNEEKGKIFAERFDTKHYKDFDHLLLNNEIKAIAVCTPTNTHFEIVCKAANAKKNIFCEKPIAFSVKEADEMINILKKNKVKGMIGHVLRFMPEYVVAKKVIESGKTGNVLSIFCERLVVIPKWSGWYAKEEYTKGAALDLQVHDIDYLVYILGKPKSIMSAGVYDKDLGGYAQINTILEFQGKEIGLIDAGWMVKGKFPFTSVLRIICEKGTIEWIFRGGDNIEKRGLKKPLVIYKMNGEIVSINTNDEDGFYLEWKYFIDCLDNDKEIRNATFQDSRLALKIALASIRSAREGKKIYL